MAQTWLVITVELVGGGGRDDLWPRPARMFVAARSHSFEQLAEAIDDAFGRWDLAHLHELTLADGTSIGEPDPDWDEDRELVDSRQTKLSGFVATSECRHPLHEPRHRDKRPRTR